MRPLCSALSFLHSESRQATWIYKGYAFRAHILNLDDLFRSELFVFTDAVVSLLLSKTV